MKTCLIFLFAAALLLIAVPQISSRSVQEIDPDAESIDLGYNHDPQGDEKDTDPDVEWTKETPFVTPFQTYVKIGIKTKGDNLLLTLYVNNKICIQKQVITSLPWTRESVYTMLNAVAEIISEYDPSMVGYSEYILVADAWLSGDLRCYNYLIEEYKEQFIQYYSS